MKNRKNILIGAALGGLLMAATMTGTALATEEGGAEAKGECHDMNSCKGTGACGGEGHGCAGKNACKGEGWLKLTEGECKEKSGTFKAH